MYKFLLNNRAELLTRCKAKVAFRPHHLASDEQLSQGVPLFLDQLTRTLRAEEYGESAESFRISGSSEGDTLTVSEMGVTAAAHGKLLLDLGFTVDQVVHAYGDLCQSITDLAVERDAPFSIDEFRTLNRCLDNAIADAVTGFAEQRDTAVARQHSIDENMRLGFLVHELRNQLLTATLAFSAIEAGKLAIGGSTASLVKRSLGSLATMLTEAISEVRRSTIDLAQEPFSVASFLADAEMTASFFASTNDCTLTVPEVDPLLAIRGNRMQLDAALINLLQNAFKFTRPHTGITLTARAIDGRVLIDVRDQCGGLPEGSAKKMFTPFKQRSTDRSGLGLGLSIARRNVEDDGGTLSVVDLPGKGCIFTIELPQYSRPRVT